MDNRFSWPKLLTTLAFWYLPIWLVGWLLGYPGWCLFLAAMLHQIWQYQNIHRLSDWLWNERSLIPPEGKGSWRLIFDGIYRQQQRHRARRRELAGVIRRFREGAEALPDAAVVFRQDGSILWCNRLAEQLLGFKWPDDAGNHIGNLIRHPDFVNYLKSEDYQHPLDIPSPINDERVIEYRIMPYSQGQCLLVARDVTHIRQLESMRRNFVANVSHELRTPLTVLKGYIELMLDDDDLGKAQLRTYQVMEQQTERMEHLIEQLLTLSRIESQPVVDLSKWVDMPAMLRMLEKEAQALSGDAAHQIHLHIDEKLDVLGDALQLRSAVSNLVFNAVRYTPAGRDIHIYWQHTRQGAEFVVQDSGDGIAPEHITRLTERFYRVDKARSRQTGGSGLGLSIVKHALSHHDSELQIHSELGKGSSFKFTIPKRLICN